MNNLMKLNSDYLTRNITRVSDLVDEVEIVVVVVIIPFPWIISENNPETF